MSKKASPRQLPLLDEAPSPDETEEVETGWFIDRRSLFTEKGLTWFQVFYEYDGKEWVRDIQAQIGNAYRTLQGLPPPSTGQGEVNSVQTMMTILERMGVMTRQEEGGRFYLRVTSLGRQVYALIQSLPKLYLALPRVIIQALAEYQMHNPALPADRTADFAIFPYWFTFYVMRHCDNYLTDEEFLRFVYKAHHTDQADEVVNTIHRYRKRHQNGASGDELDNEFGVALNPGRYRRNYLLQPLRSYDVISAGPSGPSGITYQLNPMFNEFIDELLSRRPRFRRDLTTEDWMAIYGRAIPLQSSSRQVKTIQIASSTRSLTTEAWVTSPYDVYVNHIGQGDLLYFLSPVDSAMAQADVARWIFEVTDIQFDEPDEKTCTVRLIPAWQVVDPDLIRNQLQPPE